MSLKTGKPPKKALQVVSDAIRSVASSPDKALKAIAAAPEATDLTAPLQVYTMDLKDVINNDLSKASGTSWRYHILREDEPVAAAEVSASKNSKVQFSHFNRGPFVEETIRAILQAESLNEVIKNDYEARILRIPALYVMALWLHNKNDDILIPMPPTNEYLIAKKTYSRKEFFDTLNSAAQSRIEFDDTPQESK